MKGIFALFVAGITVGTLAYGSGLRTDEEVTASELESLFAPDVGSACTDEDVLFGYINEDGVTRCRTTSAGLDNCSLVYEYGTGEPGVGCGMQATMSRDHSRAVGYKFFYKKLGKWWKRSKDIPWKTAAKLDAYCGSDGGVDSILTVTQQMSLDICSQNFCNTRFVPVAFPACNAACQEAAATVCGGIQACPLGDGSVMSKYLTDPMTYVCPYDSNTICTDSSMMGAYPACTTGDSLQACITYFEQNLRPQCAKH